MDGLDDPKGQLQVDDDFDEGESDEMDDVKGDNLDANEEEEDEPDKPRTETTSKDIATQPMLDKKGQSSQEPEKVQNQPFDEAVEVDDSEEVSSGSDNDMSRGAEKNPANFQYPGVEQIQSGAQAGNQGEDDESNEEENIPGAYNPADFANLQVSNEVQQLFQYISRFKPANMELDTKLKPFIPEYIPAVGEVDAFMKIPRPDEEQEHLGLTMLDEPCLNPSDPTALEMIILKTGIHGGVSPATSTLVSSVEDADKNPKKITQWIQNVNGIHDINGAPTVQYTKPMPDFDLLMSEFPQEIEEALRDIPFPGPNIQLSTEDYVKVIMSMLDIPIHKGTNGKSLIESLHIFFTLYLEFRDHLYFKGRERGGEGEVKAFDQQDIHFFNQQS